MAVRCTPLQLRGEDGVLYWNNDVPQSPFLSRPLKLLFLKEDDELLDHIRISIEPEYEKLKMTGGIVVPLKGGGR
jgi:hypothetical protein